MSLPCRERNNETSSANSSSDETNYNAIITYSQVTMEPRIVESIADNMIISVVADHGRGCSTSNYDDPTLGEASVTAPLPAIHWRTEMFEFIEELLLYTKHRSWKKKLLTLCIFTLSLLVVIDFVWFHHVNEWMTDCVGWLSWHPALAVVSFLLLFIACTFLFVPPAFLFFGAGYVFCNMTTNIGFGILASIVVCYMGTLLGAMLAFHRARYMTRDLIVLFAKRFPIIRAADRALRVNGFRVMLLLRLCPIVPFNALNYIGGILSISATDFSKSLIGIVPVMLLWIYCGATSQVLGEEATRFSNDSDDEGVRVSWIILLGSGTGFGVIALILTWRFAIKELGKEIAKDSAENWFRYKRHCDDGVAVKDNVTDACSSVDEGFEVIASQRILEVEEEQERVAEGAFKSVHQRRRSGMLHFIGIDTHRLDDHFDPPDNDQDEEWFWLFA
ncbi:hypothetical protein MPSEU_000422800 [Mayamaea pseudoterrestris]|nr:hypothetical protein MPSEU_000422800 [Mayamaea pseudoterrestris]